MTEENKIIEITLEDLIKGIPFTKSKRFFKEVKKRYSFLPIEFRNDVAIGIFSYEDKRIEIPVGLEFKKELMPDYESLTITENNGLINLGRNSDFLYLRLMKANLDIEMICGEEKTKTDRRITYLDYYFVRMNPFAFYFSNSQKKIKGVYLGNDGDLLFYHDNSKDISEEAEEKYRELKQKELIKKIKIIIPESATTEVDFKYVERETNTDKPEQPKLTKEDKLTEEDIKKLNDLANGI